MIRKLSLLILLFSFLFSFLLGQSARQNLKIVCLAPNLCEILFSLNAGNMVVGVSDFCEYPPECKNKPKIGGLIDPNFEAIVRSGANTAFLVPEQKWTVEKLKILGIKSYIFRDYSVNDILNSISQIGNIVGRKKKAKEIVSNLLRRITVLKHESDKIKNKKRVLIVIGREIGTFKTLFIAGKGSFMDEIIKLSGGKNCYNGKLMYPQINIEALYDLNPDVIVELLPDEKNFKNEIKVRKKDWQRLKSLNAVKNGKIYFTNNTSFVVPGIRFLNAVSILKDFLKR